MSKELLEAINKLDIRVFSLTSGRQFIGRVSYEEDMKITLTSPLEFVERIDSKTNTRGVVLLAPIINNSAPIKLNAAVIEYESVADLLLKKIYCDQLIHNTLALLADEVIEEKEELDKSNNYFDSIINAWNKNT